MAWPISYMKKLTEKKYQIKIIRCLKSLGIKKDDIIFCHSRMFFFDNFNIKKSQKICEYFLNSFFKILGKNGVFSVPLFTYDHAERKIFDKKKIKTKCGILCNHALKKKNIKIYSDPNLAVGIFEKKSFFSNITNYSPYSENSFFSRLDQKNAKLCFINIGPTSTFIHYVEKILGVHYRYNKKFKGKIAESKSSKIFNSYLFVKKKKYKNLHPKLEFEKIIYKSKKLKKKKINGGFISVISIKDYKNIIKKTIQNDKNFFIKNY
jgi:aminoglycoside N3'-acetyltransferase